VPFSDFFQTVMMEQLESFVDAFITNMPDILRKLRHDEDEQRQLSQTHEHDLDLERFIVIISFAYEGRPEAAQAFWSDPDSNLAGFLHWVSRRASTPLVSAFCEMLQAISEDEESANAAHEFLLDDGAVASGKMRRTHSLSWTQIFAELKFFSDTIRDRPALPQSQSYRTGKLNNDPAEAEPEASMMLETYLRLITRLCRGSEAVRNFLLQHNDAQIPDRLYELASSAIPSRLRACVFTTLQSLVSGNKKDITDYIWTTLDVWLSGGYLPATNMPKTSAPSQATAAIMDSIFQGIGNGFEEPTAFIQLLHDLMLPCEEENGLNDGVPFPESLGSSNRMPGIDPYVDFTLGQVFATRTTEMSDVIQLRILRLACLNFIFICLSTFNEDLVIFANQSNVNVDAAMKASNLQSYVRLHPFARVMDWIFNDKVMAALFAATHQDAAEVGNSAPDSPLVLSVLRGIEVITLIMELQATYLDIVRPIVKMQATHRPTPVANAAFASFEDGVLNNLSIIADLGTYCGTGHSALGIASLTLLEKLSTSPKLIAPTSVGFSRRQDRNKAIAALETNADAEVIARTLANELMSYIDIDQGGDDPSILIKTRIVKFLDSCIGALPNRPTVAHLLLGFQCGQDTIDVAQDSAFSDCTSVFHAILKLVVELPLGDDVAGISAWLMSLRHSCLQILQKLWSSPLSTVYTMTELRSNDLLSMMCIREPTIDISTLWNGMTVMDDDFITSLGASCLAEFLRHRAILLHYISAELRLLSRENTPTVKERILAILLGSATMPDGQQIDTLSVFDMFDFMELEISGLDFVPRLHHLLGLDLDACLKSRTDGPSTYDIRQVEELLELRRRELRNLGQLTDAVPDNALTSSTSALAVARPADETAFDSEAQALVTYLHAQNLTKELQASRFICLKAWVQAMLMMLETGDLDGSGKLTFIMQSLQIIVPKLEKQSLENLDEAIELARLAKGLLFGLDFNAQTFNKGDSGDLASDRLFQLFRVSLRAIHSPIGDATFKEILYNICFRYLTGMSDVSRDSSILRRHSTNTVKAAGERLIDVICDDAFVGEQGCRISALLLLVALVSLAGQEESKYIVESLVRVNFISALVETIKDISEEFDASTQQGWYSPTISLQASLILTTYLDASSIHSYHVTKLALLLQISQTRYGASAVLNAGFFHAVKESGLFSMDPDLRFGKGAVLDQYFSETHILLGGAGAAKRYYELLLALMRVMNTTQLSRGFQNEQTLNQGRRFLSENRSSILGIFKKSAGIGMVESACEQYIDELAEAYILLISITGFLEVSL
jgi:nuclear pore complex protein Nup205